MEREYETILLEQASGVLEITLNRPEKFNALTRQMAFDLIDALENTASDQAIRAIVLTATGKGFCAGQDLDEAKARPPEFNFTTNLNETYNKMVLTMRQIPIPIIAAINGAVAGAGLGLALAADIRYLSERAKFVPAFIAVALGPDTGASYWLPRLVGPARAAAMLFGNQKISAQQAVEMGLANEVFPDDTFLDEARTFAQQLAAGPPLAIAATKQALNQALVNSFAEQLALEAENQQTAGKSADYKEGTAAFREKRRPNFTGK